MSRQKVKIQIEKKGYISLFDDITIPITKALTDIRDLSKRSGGYSTSIEVPGDKNNLTLFGHLYDINITNGTFDTKRKYTCVVIKDDKQVFQGYVKIEGINKYEGPDGETIITFNISLQDSVSNFFGKIKDKFLNPDENNLSNLLSNQGNISSINTIFWDDLIVPKYNYPGIISTFTNTVKDKWKFSLPSQSRGYYQTTDFKPGIFLYEYIDRIVSSVGYSWNGSKDIKIIEDHREVIDILHAAGGYILVTGSYSDILSGDFLTILDSSSNDGKYKIDHITILGGFTYIYISAPDTLVDESSVNCNWKITRSEFIDQYKWDLLNNSILLDKLIVPYSGPIDVIKYINEFSIYAGAVVKKYELSTSEYNCEFYVSSQTLDIDGYLSLLPGDIIETYNSDGSIFKHWQIYSLAGTSGSIKTYNIKTCDSYGFSATDLPFDTIFHSKITTYYNRKYILSEDSTSPVRNQLKYSNITNPFYDYYNQLTFPDNNYLEFDFNSALIWDQNLLLGIISKNTSTYILPGTSFTSQQNGDLLISITQIFNLKMFAQYKCWLTYTDPIYITDQSGIRFNIYVYKNGTLMTNYSLYGLQFNSWQPTAAFGDPESLSLESGFTETITNGIMQADVKIPIIKGDIITTDIGMYYYTTPTSGGPDPDIYFQRFGGYPGEVSGVYKIYLPQENSTIKYTFTGFYQPDDLDMKLKDFLPKKLKQSDFLLGICKMFNMYIDFDETSKSLLFLPRDQYYSLGKIVDWSQKLDVSNKNNILFYPDLQYKNYIYTYKADGDSYNKAYTDNTKETYGEVDLTFDNDLLTGTIIVDNIFTSTPIARIGNNLNIYDGNASDPLENSGSLKIPKHDGNLLSAIDYANSPGIKILYDSGLISDIKSTPFVFELVTAESSLPTLTGDIKYPDQSYIFTTHIDADLSISKPYYRIGWTEYINKDDQGRYLYPYIGHFYPGPTQPGEDLNYDTAQYYFYNDISVITKSNLFYKYFQRTIRQQNEGKLLKGKFHLTPQDMASIQFYDTIYCMETYWHLNKYQYNPQNPDIVDIELISI